MLLDSGFILQVDITGSSGRLDVEGEKERSKGFRLERQMDGIAVNRDGEDDKLNRLWGEI